MICFMTSAAPPARSRPPASPGRRLASETRRGEKNVPLYVAEFQFRYNNRLNADIFGAAIGEC